MICTTAGVFPHINDCTKYYRCLTIFGLGIYKYEFSCPTNYFFNAASGICTKDKTVCKDEKFKCNAAGVFADPFEPRTFYRCIWNLLNGFYQSRHECGKQEVFDSIKKRCEKVIVHKPNKDSDSETNESSESSKSSEKPYENEDESEKDDKKDGKDDNTKEEEENEDSSERNESQEDSKDKSKENEKKKEFKCTEEGAFADPKEDNKYYICTYKNKEKNKFKKNHLKCEKKYVFDDDEGKCVRN